MAIVNAGFGSVSDVADGGEAHISDTASAYTDGFLHVFKSGGTTQAAVRYDGTIIGRGTTVDTRVFESSGDSSTRAGRASIVQAAITHAAAQGHPYVFVADEHLNYDASAVTFDNSVRVIREGGDPGAYDPKAYGAVGDGSTVDLAALQATLDAAGQQGTVYIPWSSGTYLVDDQLHFYPEATVIFGVRGAGRFGPDTATIESSHTGATAAFTLDGDGTNDPGASVGFAPLWRGTSLWRQDENGPCLLIRDIKEGQFESCRFGGGTAALQMDTGSEGTWQNVFTGLVLHSTSVGGATPPTTIGVEFKESGAAGCNDNRFVGTLFRDLDKAIEGAAGDGNTFVASEFSRCKVATNGEGAVNLSGGDGWEFIACANEQNNINSSSHLYRNNGATGWKIIGGSMASTVLSSTNFVQVDSGDEPTIVGDVGAQDNQLLNALTLEHPSQPTIKLSVGGTVMGQIDIFNGQLRLRDGSGTKMQYQDATDEMQFLVRLLIGSSTSDPTIESGTGTPEGAVTAEIGSIFLRDDGGASTSLYVKESGSGNTGWVAK